MARGPADGIDNVAIGLMPTLIQSSARGPIPNEPEIVLAYDEHR